MFPSASSTAATVIAPPVGANDSFSFLQSFTFINTASNAVSMTKPILGAAYGLVVNAVSGHHTRPKPMTTYVRKSYVVQTYIIRCFLRLFRALAWVLTVTFENECTPENATHARIIINVRNT